MNCLVCLSRYTDTRCQVHQWVKKLFLEVGIRGWHNRTLSPINPVRVRVCQNASLVTNNLQGGGDAAPPDCGYLTSADIAEDPGL